MISLYIKKLLTLINNHYTCI